MSAKQVFDGSLYVCIVQSCVSVAIFVEFRSTCTISVSFRVYECVQCDLLLLYIHENVNTAKVSTTSQMVEHELSMIAEKYTNLCYRIRMIGIVYITIPISTDTCTQQTA